MPPTNAGQLTTQDVIDQRASWRHTPMRPLVSNTFTDRLIEQLSAALSSKGFKRFSAADFQKAVVEAGMLNANTPLNFLLPDEYIFSLASDKSRSNFFVFVQKTKDSVIVYFYNPVQDQTALTLPPSMVNIRREFKGGNPTDITGAVVDEITRCAASKGPTDYRGQFHNHMGAVFDTHMNDDGESYFLDFLRSAVFHHQDFLVWSPHNWFATQNHNAHALMKPICDLLGIAFPQGTEASVPLQKGKPTGSHFLMISGDDRVLPYIQREVLAKRDPRVEIGSCYLSTDPDMDIGKIFKIIDPLRRGKVLMLGVAHPYSDSSIDLAGNRVLKLESTGIFSAAELGWIGLDQSIDIMRKADFVANFNPTLTDAALEIHNQQILELLRGLAAKYGYRGVLTANAANMLIAREFNRNTTFDPDDHRTLPDSIWSPDRIIETYYEVSGAKWGQGHTTITFSPEVITQLSSMSGKPTTEQMCRWILEGKAQLGSVVFQQLDGSRMPKIIPSRSTTGAVRSVYEGWDNALAETQNKGYVSGFIRTFTSLGWDTAADILK